MTGPEHYREAARLIDRADRLLEAAAAKHGGENAVAGFHMTMELAQVHATLALAAANATHYRAGAEHLAAWDEAFGVSR